MSVYVDPLLICLQSKKWPFKHSCHLIADDLEELKRFAVNQLCLNADWIQMGKMPHFNLTKNKRMMAVMQGAIEIDMRTFVKKLHEWEEREDDGTL